MEQVTFERTSIPVAGEYDVLVCGGGTSGVPAAVSAAREGLDVALIEHNSYLGGVPVTNINPTWHGIHLVKSSLLTEFIDRALGQGNAPETVADRPQIDGETMKYLTQEMVLEGGASLYYNEKICRVIKEGNRVTGVICSGVEGLRAFLGKRIIDATGGAMVSSLAGAEYFEGSPEGKIQGMTLRLRVGNIHVPRWLDWVEQNNNYFRNISKEALDDMRERDGKGLDFHMQGDMKAFYEQFPHKKDLPRQSYFTYAKLFPNEFNINGTRIDGLNPNRADDVNRALVTCRRQAWALYRLLREEVPGFEKACLIETSPEIGIRESRCIKGDYVLTREDCLAGRTFEDSICKNGDIQFDLHDPDHYSCLSSGSAVSIPYRCLLPAGLENLLVTGRGISADHLANSGIRQMRIVFVVGESAGLAAALSVKKNKGLRDIPYPELSQAMDRRGIWH